MKKTVLTFGLLSGGVAAAMMLVTLPFADQIGFDNAEILGYTTIVLSFLFVFFGVRSCRDSWQGDDWTFGRALKIGLGITLISSVCYVATWELIYYKLAPGFGEKYAAHLLERERAAGASEAELAERQRDLERYKELYQNPLVNIGITFLEPFPIGLVASLITAGILRRRPEPGLTAATASR